MCLAGSAFSNMEWAWPDGRKPGRPSGQGHDPQTRCKHASKQESDADQISAFACREGRGFLSSFLLAECEKEKKSYAC